MTKCICEWRSMTTLMCIWKVLDVCIQNWVQGWSLHKRRLRNGHGFVFIYGKYTIALRVGRAFATRRCMSHLSNDLEDNKMQLAWLNSGERVFVCLQLHWKAFKMQKFFFRFRCQCRSSGFERQHRRVAESWTLKPCNLQESLTRLLFNG